MSVPPIGHAVPGVRLYVLDDALAPVQVGDAGELYIGGIGVARGYLGDSAQTASVYVPDPFSAAPGARMYRSGDLVRQLGGPGLQFLYRIDDRVQIRGYRVEPREIEAVLRQHPAIADAVVIPRHARSGGRQLAAYVAGPATLSVHELREHVLAQLPEWMVPASFAVLPELPKTITGKVDRMRLPALGSKLAEAAEAADPISAAESLVLEIWRTVLDEPAIGIHDDFFALGGDSLLGVRIMTQVQQAFGMDVPWHVLYEHRTVASLAAAASTGTGRRAEVTDGGSWPAASESAAGRLSFAQESLWFLDELAPGMLAYNLSYSYRVTGQFDPAALERALRDICVRHEVLRWRIDPVDGEPRFRLLPPEAIQVRRTDLRGDTGAEERARRMTADEAARPFDLATGPLLRCRVLQIGDNDHVVQITMHHTVFDGMSVGIFTRDLTHAYAAELDHGKPTWDTEPASFAIAAAWQRERLHDALIAEQTAYWRQQLAGAPPLLALPADRRRLAEPTYRGAIYRFEVPASLAQRMRAIARQRGVTLFTVMLAAYHAVLARQSAADDIVVGIPTAGRALPDFDNVIGFFINSLPIRASVSADVTFSELISRVHTSMAGALDHQELPFPHLVAALAPDRDVSRNPIFQVWFDLFRPRWDLRLAGAAVSDFDTEFVAASFDLRLDLVDTSYGALHGHMVYATDLFGRDTIAALVGRYLAVLRAVAESPEARIWDADILTAHERTKVLSRWAAPSDALRSTQTLTERFEQQAARHPAAPAVIVGDEQVSYQELNAQANQLAAFLRTLGIAREKVVGLLLPRGVRLAAAVLGVLKAGGAYLPLAVDFPADRLDLMIRDSGAAIVLTESAYVGRVRDAAMTVALDEVAASIERLPAENRPGSTGIDSLTYVMYTSGSTGHPKGVAMPQRPLLTLMEWHLSQYAGGGPVLQFSTPTFDMSFQEMFFPWLTGGAIVPATDDERLDPEMLLGLMRRTGVGMLLCPPAVLDHIAGYASGPHATDDLPPLKQIVAAGEELRLTPAVRALVRRLDRVTLDNQYGPTETHCTASFRLTGDPGTWPSVVPIGAPLTGRTVFLLDAQLRPVPPGVPGEICIGGDAPARGYLGQPDRTAERFVPNPYPSRPGERLYRTGDQGRWRPDGNLEFLGRLDHQVKVRGCRIEPSEVEAILRQHERVRDAVVVPVDADGQTELAAYLVLAADPPKNGSQGPLSHLKAHLKAHVPDYMIPRYFATVPELPLTSVGKLDRGRLPSPLAAQISPEEVVAPRNPQEAAIVSIYSHVLGLPTVSATADFFELGGHSLLATKVMYRVREAFGVALPLRTLFDCPTVPSLADAVEEAMAAQIAAMTAEQVAAAMSDGQERQSPQAPHDR
jgi:amino acid adenylation domain-containing protein